MPKDWPAGGCTLNGTLRASRARCRAGEGLLQPRRLPRTAWESTAGDPVTLKASCVANARGGDAVADAHASARSEARQPVWRRWARGMRGRSSGRGRRIVGQAAGRCPPRSTSCASFLARRVLPRAGDEAPIRPGAGSSPWRPAPGSMPAGGRELFSGDRCFPVVRRRDAAFLVAPDDLLVGEGDLLTGLP